ncbi:hypothetical protein KY284_016017 [Solanum tuberosum]|nr:hypothetical protein KY284_016017 [Solanum tuberosum]
MQRIPEDFANRYCKNLAYLEVPSGKKSNIQQQKSQEEHEQQSEIVPSKNEAEERGEIAINYQTPKLLEVYPESQQKKRQDGGVEEDDDVSVDIQNNIIEEEESQGENEQQSEVERDEEMALNYQKAKAFKSNNPFIISIMHPSYVSHSFSLSIPKKFAKRYFLNHRNVVLSVTGKGSWSVKCTIGTKNAKFSWKALVLDNKLKTGDVCVFKVIEGTMPVSINVIIFPAVFNTSKHAEVVSDSEDPCSQYISADYQRAKAFTSENPFFIRVMQSSYVSGNSLNIPRVIGWEIFFAKRSDLVLQVPSKRSWALKCNRAKEYAKLTSGWKEFVFDNNIKVGDVCVFEQIRSISLKHVRP